MELGSVVRFIILAILLIGIPSYWLGYEKGSKVWHTRGVQDGFRNGLETVLKSSPEEIKKLQEEWL